MKPERINFLMEEAFTYRQQDNHILRLAGLQLEECLTALAEKEGLVDAETDDGVEG